MYVYIILLVYIYIYIYRHLSLFFSLSLSLSFSLFSEFYISSSGQPTRVSYQNVGETLQTVEIGAYNKLMSLIATNDSSSLNTDWSL